MTLIDTDQAGHTSEWVHVSSTIEPDAESAVLFAAGSNGSFTGAIVTVAGLAVSAVCP
jgi:hypothetical protein